MPQMITEEMKKRWTPVLECTDITRKPLDAKDITMVMMENQLEWCKINNQELLKYGTISESTAATMNIGVSGGVSGTTSGPIATWTPVLIKMARHLPPNLVAFDLFGVQPMSGPDGQIFALRARYDNVNAGAIAHDDSEALYRAESNTAFSGTGTHAGESSGFTAGYLYDKTGELVPAVTTSVGTGLSVTDAQALGTSAKAWAKMGFTIDKTGVTALSRGLYADYSHELRQDMKAVHGEDVDAILADVLVTEIQSEMNREFIRVMNVSAKYGRAGTAYVWNSGDTAYDATKKAGVYNITLDTDARWSLERWKTMLFRFEVEANDIAKDTRRGKGNRIVTSSNVASALMLAGMLDFSPALAAQGDIEADDTGRTFVGVLANGMRVYIDPFAELDYATVGYKGASSLDSGIFYCPYTPLEMYRAQGEDTFQPRMSFKTRYGLVANPYYAKTAAGVDVTGKGLGAQENGYFRKVAILNLI